MEVEPVASATTMPRRVRPHGVTAEVAKARANLREITPPDRWKSVMHEVHQLQAQQQLSPLEALRTVYSRMAAGWVPPAR